MSIVAGHQIHKLYEEYSHVELAFNKSMIKLTGLEPKKIYLKIKGDQTSCILYTCSMKGAKVIINMNPDSFELLKRANNFVNLRLAFFKPEDKNSLVFYVPANVDGYKNFNEKHKDTYIFSLSFTQKPSDDLITILGSIIQEKEKFEKRQDKRITINSKIVQELGLTSNNITIEIEKIKRLSLLRNISATGANIILSCIPKFVMNKEIIMYLISASLKMKIEVAGKIVRYGGVQGRKDLFELGIQFDKDNIPIEYKHLINSCFDKLEDMAKNNR